MMTVPDVVWAKYGRPGLVQFVLKYKLLQITTGQLNPDTIS